MILSLTDGLTKEWCIAVHLFWTTCRRIAKRSGYLFLALYLKQSRVCLQRWVAGDKPPVMLSPSVSFTRSGIPRIIPSFHRRKILARDYRIIQLYLSLFSVSKLIPLAPKVTGKTFSTITQPSDLDCIGALVSEMRPSIKGLLRRYVSGIDSIPLYQGLEFVPTWKSVPSCAWYKSLLKRSADSTGKPLRRFSQYTSVFHCFFAELAAFQFLMTFVHSREDGFSQGCLWPPYTRYAFDQNNTRFVNLALSWFESRIGPYLPSSEALGIPPITGRLCCSYPGDGKRRLFAVGNYIIQRLLYPLHQWLNKVLQRVPMDGTFDQTKPLDRLYGSSGYVYSVDLKAATDRWPLLLMFELVQALFGRSFASSAVNSALGTNIFQIAFTQKKKSVSFIAGQPLGYYSSWPLFALSHHLLVWYASELVQPGVRFTRYAVLGDDIVIADTQVHAAYRGLLDRLGVGVSEGKCLTSPNGTCEFAKKFRVEKMTIDVSPLSIKKIFSACSPIGWYNFCLTLQRPLRFSTLLRIAGLGFKAASRKYSSRKHGKRAQRLILMRTLALLSPIVGFELALSSVVGFWIPPSLFGMMYSFLLEHFIPKELHLPNEELFAYPGMRDFLEYSLLRSWMGMYLRYLAWYAHLISAPCSLSEFLNAPVYIRTWYKPNVDIDTYRFGLMFRLYDWVREFKDSAPLALNE